MCLFLERTFLEERRKLHLLILIWFFFFLSSTELYQIRWARQCVNTDVGIVNSCELVHCFCIMSMLWEGLCPFITDMNILWLAKCKLCPQLSVCCFGCACECMWGAGLWSSLLRWKQCVQPQSKMPQEQQRALAAAAAAAWRGAQIDPPVPSVPLGCTEII